MARFVPPSATVSVFAATVGSVAVPPIVIVLELPVVTDVTVPVQDVKPLIEGIDNVFDANPVT